MKNKNYLLKYQVLMLSRSKYIFGFFTFLLSFSAFSQTKEDLKKQKLAIEKEINYAADLLNKTKANKDKSLSSNPSSTIGTNNGHLISCTLILLFLFKILFL